VKWKPNASSLFPAGNGECSRMLPVLLLAFLSHGRVHGPGWAGEVMPPAFIAFAGSSAPIFSAFASKPLRGVSILESLPAPDFLRAPPIIEGRSHLELAQASWIKYFGDA
jgi:hypothetical protein